MFSSVVVYVDVDDTLVRLVGTTRMPMPRTVSTVRRLFEQGIELYCWSSGGADYARQSAEELGIADCFTAFLAKPTVLLDDVEVASWRLRQVHPNAAETLPYLLQDE